MDIAFINMYPVSSPKTSTSPPVNKSQKKVLGEFGVMNALFSLLPANKPKYPLATLNHSLGAQPLVNGGVLKNTTKSIRRKLNLELIVIMFIFLLNNEKLKNIETRKNKQII